MGITVPGFGALQTAYVSYNSFVNTGSFTLIWPNTYQQPTLVGTPQTPNVASFWMDINNGASVVVLTLPDATQVSVGQNFIIRNLGSVAISLRTHLAGTSFSLAAGIAYSFILTNNSTQDGTWSRVTYGAGSSAADANALAGFGLIAIGQTLNTNIEPKSVSTPNYQITNDDQSSLIIWTGGAGAMFLPAIDTTVDGYIVYVSNQGSDIISINPNVVDDDVKIDGLDQLFVGLRGSCIFVASPLTGSWYTIGFGNQSEVFFPIPIGEGGTGQTAKAPAFNALSPITSEGDLIIGTAGNTSSRLAIGTNKKLLQSDGTTAAWGAAIDHGSVVGAIAGNHTVNSTIVTSSSTILVTVRGWAGSPTSAPYFGIGTVTANTSFIVAVTLSGATSVNFDWCVIT